MKAKRLLLALTISAFQFIPTNAHAQYDDTPGAQFKAWAINQACRLGGEGVNMNQALGMIPTMILGSYATLAAQQDFMRMQGMGKDKIKNISINISYGVITTCPNNIGKSVYDSLIREVDYYKSTGNICTKFQQAYAQGQCLESF